MKAEGYLNGLKQNAGDTEVILYASVGTARAVGYNSFMPSYPHIEEYRAKLQELIEFGGSDNEENIRPAFQNCLDAYCHDHRERLVLIPELKTSPGNKPDSWGAAPPWSGCCTSTRRGSPGTRPSVRSSTHTAFPTTRRGSSTCCAGSAR